MAVQSNIEKLITVFGGSGFLGRHLVRALAKRGYRIRVAVRRPELAGHLQPLGRVGQIHAVQANVRYSRSVEAAARDANIVINLTGILYERGRQRSSTIQTFGAEAIALRPRLWWTDDPCLGAWRRRGIRPRITHEAGGRRKGGAGRGAIRGRAAAFNHVRTGG